MEKFFPDYKNCGINVTSSIMKHFGTPCDKPSLPFLDDVLQKKKYRNVILFLFDGLGMEILKNDSPNDSFINTHIAHELSAVYPPTTTAATNAIECAAYPCEHGWLGWTIYTPEIGENINIFLVREEETDRKDDRLYAKFFPLTRAVTRMNDAGHVTARHLSRFSEPGYDSLDAIKDELLSECSKDGNHYFYCYWGDPDSTMHNDGVQAHQTKKVIAKINEFAQDLSTKLPDDTLFLITADHGLVDAEYLFLSDYPELFNMLERPISIEQRTIALWVKEECRKDFPEVFNRLFGDKFRLYSREEMLTNGFFGPAEYNNPKLDMIIGDFVALSLQQYSLNFDHSGHILKGIHAGFTEAEMRVPLIIARK